MAEKIIHLKALDFDLPIPECVNFHDDGIVSDLQDHMGFLNWRYTGRLLESEFVIQEGTVGINAGFSSPSGERYDLHIFYLNAPYLDEVRGHEETHFVHSIKRLSNLSKVIKLREGIEIDFDKIRSQIPNRINRIETIAEIGGIFAFSQKNGWDSVCKFRNYSTLRSAYFNDAFNIYASAKIESLKRYNRK